MSRKKNYTVSGKTGAVQVMSASKLSWTNGNGSTTSLDRTARTMGRPLTQLSETSYSMRTSVPQVRLGYNPTLLLGMRLGQRIALRE